MNLRERMEYLFQSTSLSKRDMPLIEAFAREIRNEALEEAERACDDNGYALGARCIRTIRETDASSEKKL